MNFVNSFEEQQISVGKEERGYIRKFNNTKYYNKLRNIQKTYTSRHTHTHVLFKNTFLAYIHFISIIFASKMQTFHFVL